MATATTAHHIFSSSHSISRLSPFLLCVLDPKSFLSCSNTSRRQGVVDCGGGGAGVRCMAVETTASEAKTKKGGYEIQTLTGWLLKQEQAGVIDAELNIVISSISMACKQIAALVQMASISNHTGVQGAVSVQGEDQKKLDVVSNEI